jgi:hypothetical protein
MTAEWDRFWSENWPRTRARFAAWWRHEGLIVHITAPADEPRAVSAPPVPEPATIEKAWLDPAWRVWRAEQEMARTYFGGDAFPYFDTQIGPGSLGIFLGATPHFAPDTVWYEPFITDPDAVPALRFDPRDRWFLQHTALIEAGLRASAGRYLVGMPDLIENVDTLAALRGAQPLMFDMIERPDWVSARVAEINQVFFDAFDALFGLIRDPWGGNAFSAFKIWGAGKTAKVQCDAAAMISPRMFRRFVVPALTEQCAWLDYSMYHLDGTQAVVHLDALLEIEPLKAIEWTPQAGRPQGGDPMWFDLYRYVLAAGKSMQAILVEPHEVVPLLDAVGPKGLYIMTEAASETEARALEAAVDAYR